jgi:hypothetical protein
MALNPGEAAVLFVIRDKHDPDKYFVSVRRSEASSFDKQCDFIIGAFQTAVDDFNDSTDLESKLNQAIARLKQI